MIPNNILHDSRIISHYKIAVTTEQALRAPYHYWMFNEDGNHHGKRAMRQSIIIIVIINQNILCSKSLPLGPS